MNRAVELRDTKKHAAVLLLFGIISIAFWQTEAGRYALYPFTILATWFHEMGHGLAAMLTGSEFDRLVIYPDGSGVAYSRRPANGYAITDAFIAASGPLGPAIAGALLIVSSRRTRATKIALALLGSALLISTLIWVRSLTGWLVLPSLGLAILALALRGPAFWQHLMIQFLGVQASISVWQQFGYLFSTGGVEQGQLSDTAAISSVLFFPYWVWGAIISAITVALLLWSLRVTYRN